MKTYWGVMTPGRGWPKVSMLLALAAFALVAPPQAARAGVSVNIDIQIPLPPPFVFVSPPEVVVIPGTYAYAVPDSEIDIFFYEGWWWRPWEGRWYRSRSYESGWRHYPRAPRFYAHVPPGWRNYYREHRWEDRRWDYERIPAPHVKKNWSKWKQDKHWEREKTWGVQGYRRPAPPPPPQQARPPQPQGRNPDGKHSGSGFGRPGGDDRDQRGGFRNGGR